MIFLVDCNNFYVSCERILRPDLKNVPVVVLSNNDGCIISRSNEEKKLGIKASDTTELYFGQVNHLQIVEQIVIQIVIKILMQIVIQMVIKLLKLSKRIEKMFFLSDQMVACFTLLIMVVTLLMQNALLYQTLVVNYGLLFLQQLSKICSILFLPRYILNLRPV